MPIRAGVCLDVLRLGGRVALILISAASCKLSAQVAAGVSGIALDDKGSPVRASVAIISGTLMRRTLTDSGGSFSFSQLPAGTYTVCGAQLPNGNNTSNGPNNQILNSCLWIDSAAPKVTLAAGQTVTGVRLSLPAGRRLTVRVNDPGHLLPPPAGRQAGAELALHISGPPGVVRRVAMDGQDANGRTYSIVIPYGVPHTLRIQSSSFALKDDKGAAEDDVPVGVQFAPGDPDRTIVVNVSARGAK